MRRRSVFYAICHILYDKPFYGQNYNIVACKARRTAGRKEPDLNSLFILYSKFPNINFLSPLFRIPGGERTGNTTHHPPTSVLSVRSIQRTHKNRNITI